MKRLLTLAALAVAANTSHAVLLMHFNMDEASGNIADSSVNNYQTQIATFGTGVQYGLASVSAGTYGAININSAQAAQFGSAIDFGTNSVNLGNFNVIGAGKTAVQGLLSRGPDPAKLIQGSMTMMAWVNFDSLPATKQTLFTTGYFNGGWRLAAGSAELNFNTRGTHDYVEPVSVASGQWQHLAVTVGGGNVSFYRNAVLLGTLPTSFAYAEELSSDEVKIGGFGGGNENMFGRMDELKIFTTALDANAIAAAAVPLTAVPEPGTALMSLAGLAALGGLVNRRRIALRLPAA